MKIKWSTLRKIIGTAGPEQVFLSLIDNNGNILGANAKMRKLLHLREPDQQQSNFFKAVHPSQADAFKNMIRLVASEGVRQSMDLQLRNGTDQPMKWEVNRIVKDTGDDGRFLCIGYKLNERESTDDPVSFRAANYQKIFQSLNAGILLNNANGEIITANKKASEIFRTTQERLCRLNNIEDLWNTAWNITTEEGAKVSYNDNPVRKALCTGKAQESTLVIVMKNGEKRWIHFDSQPLFKPDETVPFSVVSNIIDVTKENNFFVELKELDTILKVFIDRSPNHAWIVDADENLVYASGSFYDYFGIDKKEIAGKKIREIIPDAVANALYEKHVQVLKTGVPVETEEKVKLADGTKLIFHVTIFPIESPSGEKLVGGHAVNLADKYKIEKQLRETNDRLLNYGRAVTDAIWDWDMQKGTTFRNDNLMNMIGYPNEEAKGISWWIRRIHPDDRNRVSDKIKEITERNESTWEDEYRFKCADGSYKSIRDRGFVIYENGLPVRMIGSLQDITGIKQLEDQLTQEKLQRQKEISESVIRAQERERRRIGQELHDNVNQILTSAKLFIEMLHPPGKEEQEIRERSIEYILTAINEIRKLSRELSVPELQDKSLIDVIGKLADDINASGKIKIKFVHDAECDLLSPGKKTILFRILQEQIKNIINYSKAEETIITLECKKDKAQLTIKDNGIGFDAAHTRSGAGLANIYDRANFYNGSVDLVTAPGKGCTLTVKIPVS